MNQQEYQEMKMKKFKKDIEKTKNELTQGYDDFLLTIDTVRGLTAEKLEKIEKEIQQHPAKYCSFPDARNAARKAARNLNIK